MEPHTSPDELDPYDLPLDSPPTIPDGDNTTAKRKGDGSPDDDRDA